MTAEGIAEEFRRLHYDTANATSAPAMAALMKLVPASQITFGSDYPYFPVSQIEDIRKMGLPAADIAGDRERQRDAARAAAERLTQRVTNGDWRIGGSSKHHSLFAPPHPQFPVRLATGKNPMWFRLIHAGRVLAVIAALFCVFVAAGRAQTNAEITAALEPVKISLDLIEAAVQDARSDQALADLASRVAPLRDQLRQEIETLETRLAHIEARLKQLGAPPPPNAPPEDPALAAERTRLTAERGELDAALKQARLLALRADQLADRISADRRRDLVAGSCSRARPACSIRRSGARRPMAFPARLRRSASCCAPRGSWRATRSGSAG